jgi:hypothetical protein
MAKNRHRWGMLGILLGLFAVTTLLTSQSVYAASWPVNQSESTILGGHVQAKLTYTKDHSPDFTSVGDIVTVTTELTKLDDGPLDDSFDQSSMVILYPDENQGLELIGQPTYSIRFGDIVDSGEFVPSSKELPKEIIDTTFNLYAKLYGDLFQYNGVMTPIKVEASDKIPDFDQEPYYSDQFSLKNVLVNKGTVVTLSYQAKVTKKAIETHVGNGFTFHSAMFDSSLNITGDFDFDHGFLTAEMPGIQALAVRFDTNTKDQVIDFRHLDAVHLSGTWHSDPSATVSQTLTVNGKTIPIPAGSFKDDGTFEMTVDLSQAVTKAEEVPTVLTINDNYGQTASDTTNLQVQQMNQAPEIQLDDPAEGATENIYASTKEVPFQFRWQDADSQQVALSYTIDNGTEVLLDQKENTVAGQWHTYQGKLEVDSLTTGKHQVFFDVKDSDGARALQTAAFSINVQPDVLGFKEVSPILQFPTIPISNQVVSEPAERATVLVTDTANHPAAWHLMVKQTSPFKDKNQLLKGSVLSFVSDNQKQPLSPLSESIEVPVLQKGQDEYALVQDETHYFQLDVPSGNVAGNYRSDLEWTIVAAP